MNPIADTYRTRPIQFLNLWEFDGWRLKAYGISYASPLPDPNLIKAARRVAAERITTVANQTNHYGVGFVGIHEGKTANFIFVDWWAEENELHHHVYVSPTVSPTELEYKTPSGLIACIWDLYLIGFERDAWVNHVLKKAPQPDIEGYLHARWTGAV